MEVKFRPICCGVRYVIMHYGLFFLVIVFVFKGWYCGDSLEAGFWAMCCSVWHVWVLYKQVLFLAWLAWTSVLQLCMWCRSLGFCCPWLCCVLGSYLGPVGAVIFRFPCFWIFLGVNIIFLFGIYAMPMFTESYGMVHITMPYAILALWKKRVLICVSRIDLVWRSLGVVWYCQTYGWRVQLWAANDSSLYGGGAGQFIYLMAISIYSYIVFS